MKIIRLAALLLAIMGLLLSGVAAELTLDDLTQGALEALFSAANAPEHTGLLTLTASGLQRGECAVLIVTATPVSTCKATAFTVVLTADAPTATLTGLVTDSPYEVSAAGWNWDHDLALNGAAGTISQGETTRCSVTLAPADQWLHDGGHLILRKEAQP